MSLPVMGENLTHEANQKADKYSDFIKQLATDEQLIYLPVREKQKEFLQKNPQPLKVNFPIHPWVTEPLPFQNAAVCQSG